MQTSYFAKYKGDNGVSIALYTPKWFKGRTYKKLAPTSKLLFDYKNKKISDIEYIEIYKRDVLKKLNPKQVYEELGKDSVLLCFEKVGSFCHRHIVALWLEEELGIAIEEYMV